MTTDDFKVIHSVTLPSYATFKFPTYYFSPMLASDIGLVTI